MSEQAKHLYKFGPFRLDTREQVLLRDGKPVPLTPKAFETLVALVRNSGHVVHKDELIKTVWPDTFIEDNNLAVNISMLRKALGGNTNGDQYIENIPKRGYRFAANVEDVWENSENQVKTEHPRPPAITEEILIGAQGRIGSLAVLPFANACADSQMEYLSDGITESIINSLSQLPQLRVMARSTVFRYKGKKAFDPMDVGKRLGVRAVLTGRVEQRGNILNIQTELVYVVDGSQLWGEQYNRLPSDLLVVQEEIAREISEKLRLKLSGEQKKRLAKRHTKSTEAYQTYLKGRFYWNKRTLQGLRRGVEYFQQAIRLDPDFALAYAGLADCYLLMGSVEYGALHPKDALQKAKIASLEALRLDGTLAEAHASLGYVRLFDWDWSQAEKEYRCAIELNPGYATAHHWYGLFLTAIGRHSEAFDELTVAREIDRLSLPINVGVGWYFFLTRQYERAISEYRAALEMDPNFYMARLWLGLAYAQIGAFDQALAEYQKAVELSGSNPLLLAAQGHAYALWDKKEKAQGVLNELQTLYGQCYISPYYVAAIYTALGEIEQAFRWLNQAFESRSEGLIWLKAEPTLDPLRSDSRFLEIMRGVGLP